ncbi:NAD-dependent epimerase/dehydratase family protein [Mucilaginibacter sp. AK015]|uniref:NAD-dependent epimerase/dehydratase family protein n=1 Tax=Mucilaginibacter sp. AK015 TaxID=2723072 RepID=UPI00160E46F1|nr:NAD-dependent epimerase/dehydratase family protein [Mucilaginibacter sp. AK015]MBB5396673.1 nucleoside-diphosphate-sugar epimerase [Mucilaginibacter sp. AK015]
MKLTILVIGACGQLGSELTRALRKKHGWKNVIAADIHPATDTSQRDGLYLQLDVLNKKKLAYIVAHRGIKHIYHLAAVLSATAEQNPARAWEINMQGLLNVLEVAKDHKVQQLFWPSSIAVFDKHCDIKPSTVYGISKAAGENWCQYYFERYGLDVRSLRYPGLISHRTKPGGGTTDYAVDIFHQAIQRGGYECFLNKETTLPMMYMPDAVNATLALMDAPPANIHIRSAYNIAAMSFSPVELADEIGGHLPGFEMNYCPDFRQAIADNWPKHIDDQNARRDWGWQETYNLETMTADMLAHLNQKELC